MTDDPVPLRVTLSPADQAAIARLGDGQGAEGLADLLGADMPMFAEFLLDHGAFSWSEAFRAASMLCEVDPELLVRSYLEAAIRRIDVFPEFSVLGNGGDFAVQVVAQISMLPKDLIADSASALKAFTDRYDLALDAAGLAGPYERGARPQTPTQRPRAFAPLPTPQPAVSPPARMVRINARNWQALKKPDTLEIRAAAPLGERATFIAEPLERGFGLTLGNALRRVLLSSLQGAAITAVRIDGILHEFSSHPGVREDVTDIILNVKQVALKLETEDAAQLLLSAKGPAVVRAGDIAAPGDIEIMNPDLILCHLDDGARLDMAMTAGTGKGYVPAAANRPADAPVGLIPLDALYSPVRQVAYKVENARIGQELDYDRLALTIETDGTVSARDALGYAARILQDQLELFVHFSETFDTGGIGAGAPMVADRADSGELNRMLLKKLDEFEFSVRGANYLKNENMVYVGDLVQKSEVEMLRTPNFGRKTLNEFKQILSAIGLRLGMDIPGWPPENVEELANSHVQDLMQGIA